MASVRRERRFWISFLLGVLLVLGMAACNGFLRSADRGNLPTVEPLATPQLPDWIEQISPLGEAETLAQIRIRFKDPLIPVGILESEAQQNVLRHFEIVPALPGQFRFLTPRMVGFEAVQALPKATRVRVTLKGGLADLHHHRLEQDLAWTFNTATIELSNLPGSKNLAEDVAPIDLKQTLELTSNLELDLASLREHLNLMPQGSEKSVGLDVALKADNAGKPESSISPQAQFDPSQRPWIYTVTPRQNLQKATRYMLDIAKGVRPAYGNLPSEMDFTSQVHTYAPLAFEGIEFVNQPGAGGSYGRFAKGSAQLKFNNGLVTETVVQNITVAPPPRQVPQLVQPGGNNLVSLNPWALEPATNYTITIGANLKDTFGQTLGKPVTVAYNPGDIAPDFWAPSNLNIFPAGQDLQLNLSGVNLPNSQYKAVYRVVQPAELIHTDSAYPQGKQYDLLPNSSTWQTYPISGQKNQTVEVTVPLRQQLGGNTGLLAYGVQARTNRYQENGQEKERDATFYGLVQLTNLGVFAQWFPESGLVRVNHLSDGAAVAGARVEIYESKLYAEAGGGTPRPCATGTTDRTGTLVLGLGDLGRCTKGGERGFREPPQLLTIVREGQDWAFVRTLEYSGGYGYGVYPGWESDRPISRGTIFSDRMLYRPGETAWFTGTAYYLQNGTLHQDRDVPYTVVIDGPEGQSINLGTHMTNIYGTFSLNWQSATTQPLGNYTIRAKGKNGVEITGEFRVAEFKPPNFKVDLSLNQEFALMNKTVEAIAQSNYLFGAPVQGGKAVYYVTRQQTEFTPKGWETFSFGRRWFWPEEVPPVTSDVLQVTASLDNQGKGSQTVTVAPDLPYPMTYRVDVDVTDVSNLSVGNSKTFMALPSDRLIGLRSDFVAEAGQAFPVEVVVTDPAGKPRTGQRVQVELQQMIYSSVTQVIEGSQTGKDQVEYKTVATAEVRSGSEPQIVSLTPPEAGSYRIRANFANARDELTATDVQIWATGPLPAYWGGRYTNERLELRLDKERYQPGETATVLIQSPYPEAELYLAVVRHNTLYKTLTRVSGGAPQLQFQVTPDMIPNAAVEAVLVRRGAPLNEVEPDRLDDLDKLVRIGFAPFATGVDDKYLKVEMALAAPERQPGEEQTVHLTLKNAQGQAVQGQFTVMVVNEAVLQLTGYRPPDLVQTVYAEQAISTRFADNRPDVVLQPLSSPLQKGWGYGGGFSAGAGSTRIRTDFKPLAYYNGAVVTDTSGRASVTFKLPDDLTTWRVLVVATDGHLHFGQGDIAFMTTQPLITNPVLPQFVRPGDRFDAGLSVTNTTGASTPITVNGELRGDLKFTTDNQNSTTQQLQTQAPVGTAAYRFPLVAEKAGEAVLQFTTQLGNTTDGFAVPLPIKPLDITEQVVESGVTDTQVTIPITVETNVVDEAGGLEVALASTLIPELRAPAQQVLDEEQLPCLEPAASQLAIAANLQRLSQQYGQTFGEFNPTQQAAKALERLQKLQRPDGGFAAWPGQEQSDPFISPYAAEAIASASSAFAGLQGLAPLQPGSDLIKRLQGYLGSILANPGQYDYCKQQRCQNQVRLEALMALAALGDRRSDFLSDLYAQRGQFDLVQQIKLTRYLAEFPNRQQEAATLAEQIQEIVYETGRTATVNLPQGWGWLHSATTAQAQALRLFITRQASPEMLDRLVLSLLALRRDGTWTTPYDNAAALAALVAYSQRLPEPPNFSAKAELAGKTLASHRFEGYQNASMVVQVPMAELPRGQHDLNLQKSGEGQLHYLAAYRYRLQGDQPGRFNGLRVTRTIRPANQPEVLKQMGLRLVGDPLAVEVGQVFDIGLEVITDHPVDHVVITDPLPAGLEAVDTSFQTSTPYFQPQIDSWQVGYQTIHNDRIEAYGDRLEAGVYSLHYLVRSITPGTFLWPGADVHLQYAPEEFGRSTSTVLKVNN
jgi:uncharacterized protein YfaS (alpha-2-macroglobulin family)